MDHLTWFALPFVGVPLESVTHFGNGKDANLVFDFVDGRRMRLGVSHARVETDHGIIVEVSPYDDATLTITYTGSSLALQGGRIGIREDNERWQAQFLDDAHTWAESSRGELLYVVHAELSLRSAPAISRVS